MAVDDVLILYNDKETSRTDYPTEVSYSQNSQRKKNKKQKYLHVDTH